MKNPFRRNKKNPAESLAAPLPSPVPEAAEEPAEPDVTVDAAPTAQASAPDDGFVEWRRSRMHGGIERRERNDIYEAYSVYGADAEGRLTVRLYHRYPEHERDFGLSYSRALNFSDFNRRLLGELDQGGLTLEDYRVCITNAQQLTEPGAAITDEIPCFSEAEEAALRSFCDSADILKDQRYLHSEGVLSCECGSAVGDDRLIIRFRRPLPHDAYGTDVPGVIKEEKGGYDIDNLWIMGVYNRLRDSCGGCQVTLLTSAWSIEKESLWLCRCEGFTGVEDDLLVAMGDADSFRRFGFWSLDFSKS